MCLYFGIVKMERDLISHAKTISLQVCVGVDVWKSYAPVAFKVVVDAVCWILDASERPASFARNQATSEGWRTS